MLIISYIFGFINIFTDYPIDINYIPQLSIIFQKG